MISIKELNSSYYDDFMVYLTQNNLPTSFTFNEQNPIWISLEDSDFKGFLSLSISENQFAVLNFLKSDDERIQDGLIRTALNSLYKKNILWVLCHESFYQRSFPLKEHFIILNEDHKLYEVVKNDSLLKINPGYYYIVKASIIYETGGCKGGSTSQ